MPDTRIWTGTVWQSLVGPTGPAGPIVVSADAGNLAKLGTDNRILVAQADLDARFVNVTGDNMTGTLALNSANPANEAAAAKLVIVGGNQSVASLAESNTKAAVSIRPNVLSGFTLAIGATLPGNNPYLQGVNFNGGAAAGPLSIQPYGGNVGIGKAATPTAMLDVAGSISGTTVTATGGRSSFTPVNEAFAIGLKYNAAGTTNYIGTNAAGALQVSSAGGASMMTITTTGNITSPGTAHNFAANSITASAISGLPAASSVLPLVDAATAVIGVSTAYARADHVHPLPTAAQVGGITQAQADARYVELTGDWVSGSLRLGGSATFVGTAPLDIDATTYRVRQQKTPASQTDTGEAGTICWDTAYLYACIAANQWRRLPWQDWSGAPTGASWSPLAVAAAPLWNIGFSGGIFTADLNKWSVDGSNWFSGTGVSVGLDAVSRAAHGNGTWVRVRKVSGNGLVNVQTSSDGKAWIDRPWDVGTSSSARTGARGVCFGGSRFVSLTNSGLNLSNVIPRYSVDGITWANSAAPAGLVASTLSDIEGVAFGNGRFVAVGRNLLLATNRYLHSTDGVTWTAASLPLSLVYTDVAFGNGRFTAIAPGLAALTSVDGLTWTQVNMPSSADWETLVFGGGRWIAVSPNTSTAAQSSDGITWTTMSLPVAAAWNSIAANGTVFVAVNGSANTPFVPAVLTPTPQLVTYFPITASRTLVAGDANSTVANVSTGATPVTLTVPTNAVLAFPIGTSITVMDASSTTVTAIKADAGVTLNWSGTLVGSADAVLGGVGVGVNIPGPLSQVILRKVAADSWTILY